MAYGRVSMRKTREILRLKFETRLSQRAVARAMGVSNSTVSDVLARLKASGLSWPLPEEIADGELERRLYRARGETAPDPKEPDWAAVHAEMRRKHVTLALLWQEYRERHRDGYGYSWFCQHYRAFEGRIDVVMRQSHKAGEKLFVDWAGDKLPYIDAGSGEERQASLFLAVLGASNYTYAEVFENERTESFLTAHVHAFEFFGGAPELIVPDNLKTGVASADRYEAEIAAPYGELAAHYGAAVLPARAGKPRDKAKVETGVLVAYRAIAGRCAGAPSSASPSSTRPSACSSRRSTSAPSPSCPAAARASSPSARRRSCGPCPPSRMPTARARRPPCTSTITSSSPVTTARCPTTSPASASSCASTRAPSRSTTRGSAWPCTCAATPGDGRAPKKPTCPQLTARWPPGRRRASRPGRRAPGPRPRLWPPRSWRAARTPSSASAAASQVLRLEGRYGAARLEAACARALGAGACSYRSVRSILERGLDAQPPESSTAAPPQLTHANLRGPGYYD